MKKYFFILLLAVLLPCTNLHAQQVELSNSVQETIQSLPDSLRHPAFLQALEYEGDAIRMRHDLYDFQDMIAIVAFFATAVAIVLVCTRSARRRQEERNALISKMVDNGVFNNSDTGTTEIIKTLMSTKKERTTRSRIITYASLLGIGAGMLVFAFLNMAKSNVQQLENDGWISNNSVAEFNVQLLEFAGIVLVGYGLLALVATIITSLAEKKCKEVNPS